MSTHPTGSTHSHCSMLCRLNVVGSPPRGVPTMVDQVWWDARDQELDGNTRAGTRGLGRFGPSALLGILASQINPQAHEYRFSFHLRVFQALSNPQGMCVH